jgi:hypothetical protein
MQIRDRLRQGWRTRGIPKDHPFCDVLPTGLDYRGIPTAQCLCGGSVFYLVGWFDEAYVFAGYETTALCASCGALVTVCCEIDHPNYEEGYGHA